MPYPPFPLPQILNPHTNLLESVSADMILLQIESYSLLPSRSFQIPSLVHQPSPTAAGARSGFGES